MLTTTPPMKRPRPADTKEQQLRAAGVLHRRPERVQDALFQDGTFFDPRDLVQVRYEMVRRVTAENRPISQVASSFGVTRPTVYSAKRRFLRGGLLALVPERHGPRSGRKLKGEAMTYLLDLHSQFPSKSLVQLASGVRERFGLSVHASTILRALRRGQKKPGRRRRGSR